MTQFIPHSAPPSVVNWSSETEGSPSGLQPCTLGSSTALSASGETQKQATDTRLQRNSGEALGLVVLIPDIPYVISNPARSNPRAGPGVSPEHQGCGLKTRRKKLKESVKHVLEPVLRKPRGP